MNLQHKLYSADFNIPAAHKASLSLLKTFSGIIS